jgi:Zn-dependent M28 family amino/carboxypeptidase
MQLVHSRSLAAGRTRSEVQKAQRRVTDAAMRHWVQRLSVPRNFYVQRKANQAVADWIAGQFEQWGYAVRRQGSVDNVIATSNRPAEALALVGAHYDSVPGTPGADDNASAVAAMLGCAQALAGTDAPVCFAAFNCEENGLTGSRDLVNELREGGVLKVKVSCAHILEMVGYASTQPGSQRVPAGLPIQLPSAGDFLGLLANTNSKLVMHSIVQCARDYLPDFNCLGLAVPLGAERVMPVLARSDHVPFWDAQIPAVMWTDTSEYRNPNYHQESDTPATLNYAFLGQVTQLLVAAVYASVVAGD